MKKLAFLFAAVFSFSCGISSLNPFHKERPTYTVYVPKEEAEKVNLKGIDNVVYFMKREFQPLKGEIVLNSYEGFILDVGKNRGVSIGDQFISESGAVLKVTDVKTNYSIALPTIGNPIVGESVKKLTFNKVLYIDFTKGLGKSLYEAIKSSVKNVAISDYESGQKFKKKFNLRYPSDFRRKVPISKLTGYDGYFVVSESRGVEVFDSTKKLVRIFPWEGSPVSSLSASSLGPSRLLLDFKKHATSMFYANIDEKPDEEIVISLENSIKVYHLTPTGLKVVYNFSNPFRGSYIFHVSPVDLDKDGKFEIIVDGFYRDTKSVSSGVFRVESGKLKSIAKSSLILSGFDTDGDGMNDVVYGQTVSIEKEKIFGNRVYEMHLDGKKLKKGKKVRVPKDFQVTSAQVFSTGGKKYFVYYDLQYFLDVSDGSKLLWRSPIQIGASPNCLYWEVEDNLVSYYITPKPKPFDFNGDGNQEVLFSQNRTTVPHILTNILSFDGGRVLMLYSNGGSFDWEEATPPLYNEGGIEEFVYIPDSDVFVAIFTVSNIIKNPKSKLFILRTKI
jgi:hypothetical protein